MVFPKQEPPLYLHIVRVVVFEDEQQNPEYSRSACWAERPILIPSIFWRTGLLQAQAQAPWV